MIADMLSLPENIAANFAWISRLALSGHFVQVFALPQVIAMIDKFLEWLNTAAPDRC
jgi:hypothetical protein